MSDRLFDNDAISDSPSSDRPPGLAGRVRGWLEDRLAEERGRLGLWLPVGLGAGVVAYFALPLEPPWWSGGAAVAAPAILVVLVRRRLGLMVATMGLMAACAGFLAGQVRTAQVHTPMLARDIGPVDVTGRVLALERQEEGTRIVLGDLDVSRLAPERTPARVRIRLPEKHGYPAPGARVRVRAMLHPPPPPAEPGAYDFQRHAYFLGIGAVGYSLGPALTLTDAPTQGWRALSAWLESTRDGIGRRAAEIISDPAAAAVTTALLNGSPGAIPEQHLQAMRDSGLAHLLSISGLHIGLVAGIVFFTLRAMLALVEPLALHWPIKKIAAVAAIAAALAYTVLVGAPVPTLRSVLMTGLALIAVVVDRDPFSMRLVAFAAAVVVLVAPESLLGPSFQMSFGAVIALIAAYEVASPALARWRSGAGLLPRVALYLGGVALTSVVATAATTPFALYHFQTIAFYGVVANMLAVPLTSFWVMPCGVLAYALMPFGLDGPALWAMGCGVEGILWTAGTVAGWPGATALVPAMPTAGLAAVVLGGLWLAIWRGRWRLLGAPFIVVGLLTPWVTPRPDLFVSPDGAVMAVRMPDGRLSLSSDRAGRFAAETWLRRDGRVETGPAWPRSGSGAGGRLACDPLGCLYRPGVDAAAPTEWVALVRDPQALSEDCRAAAMVIASVSAGRCGAPVVIDRWALARSGGHTIRWDGQGGRVVDSVTGWRGTRPWTVP